MIVALHGFTGCPEMWSSIGLSGPCLLGHCAKNPASGTETFSGEVDRLADLLTEAPVHLVGYSLGARLSLALALAYPERVRALTLIGCNPGIEDDRERERREASDGQWSELLRTQGIAAFVDAWQALPLWESQARLPSDTRAALRRQRLAHDPQQLAYAMQALGTGVMPPLWNKLETVRMPVQVLVGELDSKYQEIGSRMCLALPNASFYSIANAGHNPVLEQPQSVQSVIKGMS